MGTQWTFSTQPGIWQILTPIGWTPTTDLRAVYERTDWGLLLDTFIEKYR